MTKVNINYVLLKFANLFFGTSLLFMLVCGGMAIFYSALGLKGLLLGIAVTWISYIGLLKTERKKAPTDAGTSISANEQELRQNPCSQYNRK